MSSHHQLRAAGYQHPALPGATFASPAAFREYASDARAERQAVADYAEAIRPSAVRRAVRLARKFGAVVTTAQAIRDWAADDLRESLTEVGVFDAATVQWYIAHPGEHQAVLYS
jgi:hypothetical protein